MYAFARRLAGLHHDPEFVVNVDMDAAKQLFHMCIDEQNHPGAIYNLAQVMARENSSQSPLPLHSLDLFCEYITETNSIEKSFTVARSLDKYLTGRYGTCQNVRIRELLISRIVRLYGICVEANHHGAMYHLATLLIRENSFRDIPRAISLYQKCIDDVAHLDSFIPLLRILTYEQLCTTEETKQRVLQLCAKFIQANGPVSSLIDFVRGIWNRPSLCHRLPERNLPLAIDICELCVAKRDLPKAWIELATLLVTENSNMETNVARATQVFRILVDRDCFDEILLIVETLVWGTRGAVKDTKLAKQICEMCIERKQDVRPMIIHAEIMAFEAHDVDQLDITFQRCQTLLNSENITYSAPYDLMNRFIERSNQLLKQTAFAKRLVESFINTTRGKEAMIFLGKLLIQGKPGVEKDLEHGLRLCEQYLQMTRTNDDWSALIGLLCMARDFADPITHANVKNIGTAARLYQICTKPEFSVGKKHNRSGIYRFSTSVIMNMSGIERDIDLVVEIFSRCIDTESSDSNVVEDVLVVAKALEYGNFDVEKDIAAAMRLYELCIQKTGDLKARSSIVGILTRDEPGVERNLDLAEVHCNFVIAKENSDLSKVVRLAKSMAHLVQKNTRETAPAWFVDDTLFAVRILKKCVDTRNHGEALLELVKIYWLGATGIDRDIEFALNLCERFIDANHGCSNLVREITSKMNDGKTHNPDLARFYMLCIERSNDPDAMVALARMLLSEESGIKDVNQGIELCERYFNTGRNDGKVLDIARQVYHHNKYANASIAADLSELCIRETDHDEAKTLLANILTFGGRDFAPNFDRAVRLCEDTINQDLRKITSVLCLAHEMESNPRANQYAERLFELCIARLDSCDTVVVLRELMVNGSSFAKRNIDRLMCLCRECIHSDTLHFDKLSGFVTSMARGVNGIEREVTRAIQLCEMCIYMERSPDAMHTLAEILLTRTSDMDRDVERATRLCERYLETSASCVRILDLANSVATGQFGRTKDVPLAVRLFELCIEKHDDPQAKLDMAVLLLREAGNSTDLDHTVQLLEKTVLPRLSYYKYRIVTEQIANGTHGMQKNIPLAVRLYEFLIDKTDDPRIILELVELLLSDDAESERDVDRAVHHYENFLRNKNTSCNMAIETALNVAHGKKGMLRDIPLGMRLCDLCIQGTSSPYPRVALAEMMMIRGSNTETGVVRMLEICEGYGTDREPIDFYIRELVQKIAMGTSGLVEDIPLALRILEMGVERNCVHSMTVLAQVLIFKVGDEAAYARAMDLFKKAIQRGCHGDVFLNFYIWVENMVRTSSYESRCVQFGIQICEVSLETTDSVDAMVFLAELLMSGAPEVERNVNRAMRLCKGAVYERCEKVRVLGRRIARGTSGMQRDFHFAKEVFEMCINGEKEQTAPVDLAELLCSDVPENKVDVERVMQLCELSLAYGGWCDKVAYLAKRIATETGMVRDMGLAVRLCELCIEEYNDPYGMVALAEMLLMANEEVEQDIERAVELCGKSLLWNSNCHIVVDLAKKISTGTARIAKDVGLATKLLDMCVEARNDHRAMFYLGEILLCEGKEADAARASQLITLAIESGFDKSIDKSEEGWNEWTRYLSRVGRPCISLQDLRCLRL